MKQQRSVDEQAAEELIEVQERIVSLEKQKQQQEHKSSLLEVRAPIAGVVLPAPYRAPQSSSGQLQAGRGTCWIMKILERPCSGCRQFA